MLRERVEIDCRTGVESRIDILVPGCRLGPDRDLGSRARERGPTCLNHDVVVDHEQPLARKPQQEIILCPSVSCLVASRRAKQPARLGSKLRKYRGEFGLERLGGRQIEVSRIQ